MGKKNDVSFVFTLKNLFSGPASAIEHAFGKLGAGALSAEKQIDKLQGKIDSLESKLKEFKSKNKDGVFGNLFHGKSAVDHFLGSSKLDKFEKGMDRIKHGFKNATIASAGIDAGLVTAIWKGIEFQKSMQKAQAGAGRIAPGDKEEAEHQREVERAVKKYTIHPYNRLERAEYFATAETSGFSREKAAKAHEEVMNFGTASGMDLGEATRSIITISSQFKNELEKKYKNIEDQVGFAGDIFVSAAHKDLAIVPELLESFKQSAGYFIQEGIPITQALALVGHYSNFKKGSESGTDYKNLISYLSEIRVGRRGAEYFETAGIPFDKLPKGDFIETFKYFEKVLNKLPEKKRPVALKDWFGEQGGPAFMYLEQSGIGNVVKTQKHFEEHGRGQARIKTEEKMAGAQGEARLIERDFGDLFTDVGDELLKLKAFETFLCNIRLITKDILQALGPSNEGSEKMKGVVLGLKEGVADAFETISETFKSFMETLGIDTGDNSKEAGNKLGYFISQIVIFGAMIAPIALALAGLGGILSMIILPIYGLVGIFSILGAWPALLIAGFLLLCYAFDDFLPMMKKIVSFIWDSAKPVFLAFGTIVKTVFSWTKYVIQKMVEYLEPFFSWLGDTAKDLLGLVDKTTGDFDAGTSLEDTMGTTLKVPYEKTIMKVPYAKDLDIKEAKEASVKKETGEVKVTFDNLPKNASVERVKKGFPEIVLDVNKGGRWATA